jgi:hypothetical protein
MTFLEFHTAIAALAGDNYFAVRVEVATSTNRNRGLDGIEIEREHVFEWSAYVAGDGIGWTKDHATPEAAIAEMSAKVGGAVADDDEARDALTGIGEPAMVLGAKAHEAILDEDDDDDEAEVAPFGPATTDEPAN